MAENVVEFGEVILVEDNASGNAQSTVALADGGFLVVYQ